MPWAGREILSVYLSGLGRRFPNIVATSDKWKNYMQGDPELTSHINLQLKKEARRLLSSNSSQFQTEFVNLRFSANTQNGEDITGYNFLHGTNGLAGGFQVLGSARIRRDKCNQGDGSVQFFVRYYFNDVVDSNGNYWTDTLKDTFAKLITIGMAHPYTLSVQWTGTPTYEIKQGKPTSKGWPFH